MRETLEPQKRSLTRTIVLLLLAITLPVLGLILGGLELGSGNYRFGTLLILLAVVCPDLLWQFLRALAPM
jgi:hypothetical protein